jgi:hypothetical protein
MLGTMRTLILIGCFLGTSRLLAQSPPTRPEPREEPPPIEDNSFLIEEAYNQGRGVVQHINTFSRVAGADGWEYTFTQEWPLGGRAHQLSYTIPVSRTDAASGARTGIGDVAINYRYQVSGLDQMGLAFAPRASLLLPTGASRHGLGSGGTGIQFNLPFSAELPARLVAHSNAGITYTPRARDSNGNSAATQSYALGQSLIWLAHPKLNLMLESIWISAHDVVGPGQTVRTSEFLLSPGLRGAIDFPSGLQIVPGIAFPFGIASSRGERAVFVYLSLEHPFARGSQ